MEEFFIGDLIRCKRKSLKLSQKKLGDGICDHVTISRLENGIQVPSHNTVLALMERLDLPKEKYIAVLSQKEVRIEQLHHEINVSSVLFERATGENKVRLKQKTTQLIEELETLSGNDSISLQLIEKTKILLDTEKESYSPAEQREHLLSALRLTVPDFEINTVTANLYTTDEIALINQIAVTYAKEGDQINAIYLFKQLYNYVRTHLVNTVKHSHLNLIIQNYIQCLNASKAYQEANTIAKEGYAFCLENGTFQSLPGILCGIAESAYFLGDIEESRKYYTYSYYFCKIINHESGLNAVIADAKEYLDMDLPH